MFRKQATLFVSAVLALAANACATREARPLSAAAVTCPGATLHTAAEVESYAACSIVNGNLTVATADASDLSSLSQLREVTGKLSVTNNPGLQDLSGLDNLTRVGALEISNNAGLYTARGLGQLESVGALVVENNRKLNSLSGVRSLTSAGSVKIQSNPVLCALGMLPALQSVESSMLLQHNRGISRGETQRWMARAGHGEGHRDFAKADALQVASSR